MTMAQTGGNRGKKTSNYDFIFIDQVQQFDLPQIRGKITFEKP